ncbi:hypothetical protein [Pseudoalteromonas sp. 2CM28B]|uniref:capsular polysaccharide export protein, LipB/KpsS family n=1 Tax=Pseudoalteromonas sp. 2CM28B TaxID=2929851 RepID=UPI0020C055B7|nr:hypothetical protein [Pseudoalteromonas sp. 2CM28B]MCK8137769.1 hypothetical protein [Pseudoalteromonas sp. 2CM28B]
MKILLSDGFHINKRNFKPLFDFLDVKKAQEIRFINNWKEIEFNGAVGNYREFADDYVLQKYANKIKTNVDLIANEDSLRKYQYQGIEIWPLIKSELAAFTIADAYTNKNKYPYTADELFEYHFNEYLNDLILNYCVACYWIDSFKAREKEFWQCSAAFVFSGSYIYTKVLLTLLKKSPVKCFVIESSFLGTSFYCDEQYEHLPNNYLHQYKNYREQAIYKAFDTVKLTNDADKLDYLRSQALNKFMGMNNKNVSQPRPSSVPRLDDISKPSILLVCQVLNDFSILESDGVINSIEHYKKVIMEILNGTDFNIIVKTHPWEKSKIHLTSSFTLNTLNEFVYSLNDSFKSRVYLDEDINIYHLFSNVSAVLTYCSQAGIEAATYGKKVIVNHECSYANADFTAVYQSISEIPELLSSNTDLEVDEFESFLDFMIAFNFMSIGNEQSSIAKLQSKLSIAPKLAEYHRSLNETSISPFYN